MKFESAKSLQSVKAADTLLLPFWKGKKGAEAACDLGELAAELKAPLKAGDFEAKEGQVSLLYLSQRKEKRVLLLGLGEKEKVDVERLRRAYGAFGSAARKWKAERVNVVLPECELEEAEVVEGIADGLLLTNYAFTEYKTEKKDPVVLLKTAVLIGAGRSAVQQANRLSKIASGVYQTRDLVNRNADEVNPTYLAALARQWGKDFASIKTTVFDKKRIEKEGMGLFLAVGQGAAVDPAFIIMEYKGAPKKKDHTVLIGKGVTYDTGGLNLKPTGYIEDMKCDMGGAGTVFGLMYALAQLELKVNVTVIVASAENAIGAKAYKPGDVYTGYSGKTVEIGNTDAEGRLTMADALAYAEKKLKPTRMIDLATLTGAMLIALGEEAAGLMSNDDDLAEQLMASGERTYERVWRLPLYEEYKEQLKSDFADINNVGGRHAGSITAGLFLQEFVEKTPWAHLDIAGTAYLSKARRYHPKNASGIGVRLLVDFLESCI